MGDLEPRGERLRRPVHQPVERPAIPVDVALGRRLLHHHLLAGRLFGRQAPILDDVRRRLRDDEATLVEPLAPGAAGDLQEVAHAEDAGLLSVELAELREQHGPDRDVHADAQRVGAADDLEEALLRQPLDEQAVPRQEPRVVDADPVAQEALELLAVGRVEAGVGHRDAQRLLVALRRDVDAHQILRLFGGAPLGEVDQVDRRAVRP